MLDTFFGSGDTEHIGKLINYKKDVNEISYKNLTSVWDKDYNFLFYTVTPIMASSSDEIETAIKEYYKFILKICVFNFMRNALLNDNDIDSTDISRDGFLSLLAGYNAPEDIIIDYASKWNEGNLLYDGFFESYYHALDYTCKFFFGVDNITANIKIA